MFNPFSTNVPLLYPLKTSENWGFSDAFRGYRGGTFVGNELTHLMPLVSFYPLLKTIGNQRFTNVIREYRKRPVTHNMSITRNIYYFHTY